jgi:hypothetical protein
MTNLTWDGATLATGGQMLIAAALAVQILVLRPRAARQNLALSARIIGDDVTLDQNHGLLPVEDARVERVHQLLKRLTQDPATAKSVLIAADAEVAAASELETRHAVETLDRIRMDAYLTRLADACSRYLHDAWPLASGAQRARHAFLPSSGRIALPPADESLDEPFDERVELVAEYLAEDGEPEVADDALDVVFAEHRESEAEQREYAPPAVTFDEMVQRVPTSIDLTGPQDGRDGPDEDIVVRLPAAPALGARSRGE